MGVRFNPPPNWPPPPLGFVPPPRWQPDPSWPAPPAGWQLWVEEDAIAGPPRAFGRSGRTATGPGAFASGPATATQPSLGGATQVYPGGPQRPDGRPGPAGPPGPPGSSGRANGFAVASFVLGLIGAGVVFSVIFGVVALRQIRGTGQRGRGLAVAGLVLSGLWVLIAAGVLLLGRSAPPASPASPGRAAVSPSSAPAGRSQLANVFSLTAGDCFQNPPAGQTLLGVTYVTLVPCTTPHNAQVFVQFEVPGTSYPGTPALKRAADLGCHARVPGAVQTPKITDTMTLRYLYPLPSSWATGHRTVTCLIVSARAGLTSSLLRAHPAR